MAAATMRGGYLATDLFASLSSNKKHTASLKSGKLFPSSRFQNRPGSMRLIAVAMH